MREPDLGLPLDSSREPASSAHAALYRELVDELPVIVYLDEPDLTSTNIFTSHQTTAMLGYTPEDWTSDAGLFMAILHPDDRDRVLAEHAAALATGEPFQLEYRMIRRDGSEVWMRDEGGLVRDADGTPRCLRGFLRDITARKRIDALASGQAELLELVATGTPLPTVLDALTQFIEAHSDQVLASILLLDEDGVHLRHGAAPSLPVAYCEIVDGIEIGPAVGSCGTAAYRRAPVFVSDIDSDPLWADYREIALGYGLRACWSTPIMAVDGTLFGTFAMYYSEARGCDPHDLELVEIAMNVASLAIERSRSEDAMRASEERYLHQALHDSLTGLPNRTFFRERIERAISVEDDSLGVVLIDIDRFKEINDTFGHYYGDLLLVELARRFQSILRKGDTVARLGGDEFGLIVPGVGNDVGELDETLARILAAIGRPFEIDGLPFYVEASIGVALYPAQGNDVDLLVKRADIAMYAAKKAGTARVIYSPEIDHHDPDGLTLLSELPRAISQREFVLHYQPKVDVRTGALTSVEALIRWRHPTRGFVPPFDFIPLTEKTGLIHAVTQFVLDEALGQIKRWDADGHRLTVAVNLSMRNLHQESLPDDVAALLQKWDLTGDRLMLEITESAIVSDPAQTKAVVGRLSALGVGISIDDFGTGYTSLSYLARLELDQIKIDRSFVSTMDSNTGDAAIVRSIISLGHDLGLEVVAEGVETAVTWEQLALLGCDVVQGYYFSRPLPAEELHRVFLGAPSTDASWREAA